MGRLGRPELDPGPLRDLYDALFDLRERAGNPGVRLLETPGLMSSSTVHRFFASSRLPNRKHLALIANQLAKHAAENRETTCKELDELWVMARDSAAEVRSPPSMNKSILSQASTREVRLAEKLVDLQEEMANTRDNLAHFLNANGGFEPQAMAFQSPKLMISSQSSPMFTFLTPKRAGELLEGRGEFPDDREWATMTTLLELPESLAGPAQDALDYGRVVEQELDRCISELEAEHRRQSR